MPNQSVRVTQQFDGTIAGLEALLTRWQNVNMIPATARVSAYFIQDVGMFAEANWERTDA